MTDDRDWLGEVDRIHAAHTPPRFASDNDAPEPEYGHIAALSDALADAKHANAQLVKGRLEQEAKWSAERAAYEACDAAQQERIAALDAALVELQRTNDALVERLMNRAKEIADLQEKYDALGKDRHQLANELQAYRGAEFLAKEKIA